MPESSSPTSTAAPGADVRDPPDHEADRYRVILDSVVEAIVVFDPVTYAIEEVKKRAPVWKKETTEDGFRWINWESIAEAAGTQKD